MFTYIVLVLWFWRTPVASISQQLVQPFGNTVTHFTVSLNCSSLFYFCQSFDKKTSKHIVLRVFCGSFLVFYYLFQIHFFFQYMGLLLLISL